MISTDFVLEDEEDVAAVVVDCLSDFLGIFGNSLVVVVLFVFVAAAPADDVLVSVAEEDDFCFDESLSFLRGIVMVISVEAVAEEAAAAAAAAAAACRSFFSNFNFLLLLGFPSLSAFFFFPESLFAIFFSIALIYLFFVVMQWSR